MSLTWSGVIFSSLTNKRTRCFDMIIRFHASPLLFIAFLNFEDKIMHKQSSVGESIQDWRFSMHILTTLTPEQKSQKWTITFLHTSFKDFKSIKKVFFFFKTNYILYESVQKQFSPKTVRFVRYLLFVSFVAHFEALHLTFLLKRCPNFVGSFENLSERYEEKF